MSLIIRAFILGCLLWLPLVNASEHYLPSIQKIIEKGKLVVAINAYDAPPLFWQNEQGVLMGSDIDLANYLGQNLGVPVEYVRTAQTFNDVVDVVNAGQADIAVSLLTPNLIRARKVFFSEPYLYLNKLLVYNRLSAAQYKVSDPANQIADIKNLKIGVLRGSSYVGYAKQYYPNAKLVLFPTVPEALTAVAKGQIFGFFGNSANAPYALEKDKSMNLYVGVSQFKNKVDPIAIAVSPQYPDLVSWIDLALKLKKSDSEAK